MKDFAGYEITGTDARANERIGQAIHEMQCLIGDPFATITQALEFSPASTIAHVAKAWMLLLGTEPGAIGMARDCWREGSALAANDRERRHLAAVGELVRGRWRAAGRLLEDLSIDYPRDALALQAGHHIDFFVGDSRMLRDRIGRAIGQWDDSMPGYHAVLGMHAFGLEECGDYGRAEAAGRRAVELEPRDGWAQHAVAHVMEMQGRRRDGISWMRGNEAGWSTDSFFAVHNWWHLAVLHLGLDEIDEALALYDGPIAGPASPLALRMIDQSSLLWRLELAGVDVGNRWQVLADRWAPHAAAGNYAFNDWHAMMAFLGAGRHELVAELLQTQARALDAEGDNADFLREVGAAATQAILAFGAKDMAGAARLLRDIRSRAHRFGGSHAQRDLIDLTLIAAAHRGGDHRLAQALCAERVAAINGPLPAWLAGMADGGTLAQRQRLAA